MSRHNIGLITVLSAIALLGLIVTQLYWINNAFTLKQQHFSLGVNEALNSLVYKLEKQDAASKIKRRLSLRKQGMRWMMHSDSTRGDSTQAIKIFEDLTTDSAGVVLHKTRKKTVTRDSSSIGVNINVGSDEPFAITRVDSADDRFRWMMKQTDMVSDIFDELVSINIYKGYNDKIDTLVIDSMLKAELLDNGVKAKYEYGIYNNSYKYFPISTKEDSRKEILNSVYKVNLAPYNVFLLLYCFHYSETEKTFRHQE